MTTLSFPQSALLVLLLGLLTGSCAAPEESTKDPADGLESPRSDAQPESQLERLEERENVDSTEPSPSSALWIPNPRGMRRFPNPRTPSLSTEGTRKPV